MRRHDDDAGGDPEVLERKAELRERVWDALKDAGASRFPGAHGRIPNFIGAEDAAERLRRTEAWQRAATLKCNPDSPQWPVRQRALEDGKTVYMAVPRLKEEDPFFCLDPDRIDESPRRASSIKGAERHATKAAIEQLEPVDLVVTGCVAVTAGGARLGKGGGFSDLEFAIASAAGLIDDHTIVATTVHEVQVLADAGIPMTGHDVPLDLIVTPERIIEVERGVREVTIDWDELTDEKIASIPVLQRLSARR